MEIQLKSFIKEHSIVSCVNFPVSFQKHKNNSKISYITNEPYLQNIRVQKYFEKHFHPFSVSKFSDACRMVLLSPKILENNISQLSYTEMKKLRFVEALLSRCEVFVFVDFEQGFYAKSRSYYQKLFLKLTKYGKSVLVFTKDISFLFGMSSEFYLWMKNKYEVISSFYDSRIYQYVSKPIIISYVESLKNKGIHMEDYIETKEVLKAIYRSVSNGERL